MQKLKVNRKESGLTLIEVLASIIILTLIITAFLTIFLQSAKTNKASEKIIEATYIAQVEMENIHAISDDTPFDNKDEAMKELNYEKVLEDHITFTKFEPEKSERYIVVKLTESSNPLTHVLVKVYNNENKDKLEAQMETILSWEANVD